MMSKLWVLLCAIIPVGNLAETGLIAFMTRNFQSSTYLKTDRWKPHKVPPVVQRRASIPVVFLLLFVIFSSLDLFVICLCIAACLVFNNISFSFFLFLSFSKYSSLFFSFNLFRYSFCLWEPDFTILNYLYQYMHYKFTTNELYSWYDHSSTTSKTERVLKHEE